MKKFNLFKMLAVLFVLITGINQVWADPAWMWVIGDPIGGDWTNSSQSYRIASDYGKTDHFYIVVYMEHNSYFALSDGSNNRYAPSTQHTELTYGSSAVQGDYSHNDNSWKYTGPTGLVKLCISQKDLANTHYPYVWVEKYWDPTDDIDDVLAGNKVMFYWGDVYNNGDGNGWKHLYGNSNNTDRKAFWLAKRQVSGVPTDGGGWNNFAWGAVSVASGRYYISNSETWGGRQMEEDAVAGKAYMAYGSGVKSSYNYSTATFTNSGSYSITYGTANSGVSASCNQTYSVIGKANSIYGYYIKPTAGGSWTEFNPSDADELAAGTYSVKAIVTDGVIYVDGATASLTVRGISLTFDNNSGSVGVRADNNVTLRATTVGAGDTPNIVYERCPNSSFSSSVTTIASTTSTSQTWAVPNNTSNQTYYVRARVTTSGYECTSNTITVTAYGKKTIHVRNNNDWSSFKIHHWGDNDIDKTTWGSLPSCPNEGGQWYTVVIYKCASNFVLTNEGSYNQDKTVDLSYEQSNPTLSNGGYYEMSTNEYAKQTLSSSSAPATPGATTNEATVSSATSVVFNYSVNANRDKATPGVAFKQSDSNIDDAATLYSGGTKATGSAISGNASGSTSAQTITAGKDWYYVAYGTNSVGTGYGSIRKIRTTAVTLNRQGGTTGSTSVVAVGGKAMPSATMPTRAGYDFAGYYTSTGGSGTKYYNVNGSSANTWPTDQGASVTLHADWTPLQYDVTLKLNGGTGTEDQVVEATSGAAMPTTIKTAATAIVIPTKTGYNFNGYWDATSGGTQYYTYTGSPAVLASARSFDKAANTTLYAQWVAKTYTVTVNDHDGTSGPGNQTVTYDAVPSNVTPPTKSGYGFDGYWTQETGGIQVINERGEWKAGVENHTDNDTKWCHDGGQTIHAHWLTPGYYAVGKFNNWEAQGVMTSTGVTNEVAWTSSYLYKKDFEDVGDSDPMYRRSYFKIRQVVGGGSADVWWGLDSDNEFGQNLTHTIQSGQNDMKLQIYYDGEYTFKLNTNTKSLTVKVPVVNRLEIYSINNATSGTVDGHTLPWLTDDWETGDAENTVTKTVQLERGKWYYFKPVYNSYYYGKTANPEIDIKYNGDTPPSPVTGLVDGQSNLKVTADLKGDYKFDFNYSDLSLTVTFPTRRQINYSVVTKEHGTGNSDVLTAENNDDSDYAVASGRYVADGNSVTFRAPAANPGYTFRGWFSKNNPSNWTDGLLEDDAVYTTTISANTTVYAVYSEDAFTVTVGATTGGSITTPSSATTVTAHPATGATIVAARANEAWHFNGWTSNNDKVHFANDKALSTTVTTTENATITANFVPRFGLNGSLANNDSPSHGMPGWEFANAADFEVKSFNGLGNAGVCLQCTCTLDPNETYKFRVLDRDINNRRGCSAAAEPDNVLPAGGNWQLNHTEGSTAQDVRIKTVGRGTYIFHITNLSDDGNEYPSIQVERQPSWLVSIGQGYVDINGVIHSNSSTGGTMSAEATESGTTIAITDGKWIASGGTLAYTASPEDGYTLAHWYGTSDYSTSPFDYTSFTVSTEAANVYAKFVETSTTVEFDHNAHGHITVDGVRSTRTTVGVTTTRALVAVPDEGYYFAGWSRSDNADFHLDGYAEVNASATLTGDGAGRAGTLTANFVELNKVYFRNEFIDGSTVTHWENVYVYFNTGEESGCPKSNSSADFKKQMSLESGNVYWAYVPRSVTTTPYHNLAFSNHDYAVNTKLDGAGNECIRRGDYQAGLDMFVPQHSASETISNATYYKGYWKHHNAVKGVDAKYYMKRYTGGTSYVDADDGAGNNHFSVFDENTIVYSLRIDNMTDAHNRYRIDPQYGDVWYITNNGSAAISGDTVKTTHCDNLPMTEYTSSTPTFVISPSSEGMYAITIDMSGDVMRMSVNYPIAVGDYRLKHTYTYGSSKTCYSDIIKSNATYPLTVSMYIAAEDGSDVDTNIDGTMVLEKCTNLDGGKPVFGSSTDVSAYSLATFDKGKGVYQFDITVANNAVSKVENVKLYDGVYYVKADSLPGNWANYKLNVMGQNTINYDKENSKTFDYYYCHWYGNRNGQYNTNVKCIIANEYNNQLSDTLKGDDVLGAEVQTLPHPANVRFSYNSYTNEIKRTYINGSEKYHDKFLFLEGTEKVNANGSGGHSNKLTDENNWIYQLDIKAQETARVRLTAMYGNNDASGLVQELIGSKTGDVSESNTVEILGGNSSATDWHDLRIIYDFKTNFLLAAWLASTDQTIDKVEALNTNVMILRQDQGDAKQITINTGKSLTEVDTVYTAFSFTKAHLTTAGNEYARKYYWVSFPYAVKISDVFGSMGEYAKDWVLREYDGKGRAENGFWAESASNWKFITDKNKVLTPYQGYLLQLSLPKYTANGGKWVNNVTKLTLYFPSNSSVGSIVQKNVNATLGTGNPSDYYCSINRTVQADGETPTGLPNEYDRRVRDSYWHCIGAPSFANETNTSFNAHNGETTGDGATWIADKLPFLYTWNSTTNELTATSSSGEFKFMALKAYLVQCNAESISWTNVSVPSSAVAARRAPGAEDIHFAEFNLNILRNEESLDHTYVRLTDKEDVTADFEFGHDLCKEFKSGANIYTLIDQLEVAGNSLPLNLNTTTIVPVGVKIAADGQYTFAMPEGTNGIGVTLIDNVAGTRTNLGLTDYTVDLTAGKHDTRFMLEISPIANTPTNIESAGEGLHDTGTRKVMMDGKLYIIKEGYVFDARGAKVK